MAPQNPALVDTKNNHYLRRADGGYWVYVGLDQQFYLAASVDPRVSGWIGDVAVVLPAFGSCARVFH